MICRVHRSSQLLGTAARRRRTGPPALWCTLVRHCHGTAAASNAPEAASVGQASGNTVEATFVAMSEPALQHLASMLADDRRAGDCICLFGAVGAGKSVFR